MFIKNSRFYSLVLIAVDVLILLGVFAGAYVLRVMFDPRPLVTAVYAISYLKASLVIVPVWVVIFMSLGLYKPAVYNRRLAEWSRILIGTFIGILVVIGWEYATKDTIFPARLVAVYSFIGSLVLLIAGRELTRLIRSLLFRFGYGTKRVLLIGTSSTATNIAISLADTKKSGFQVIAVSGPKKVVPENMNVIHYGNTKKALENITANNITAIIQTNLFESAEKNQAVLSASQVHHIDYSFIPGESEFYSGKNMVDVFLGYPIINVYQTPLVGWGAIVKRITDLMLVIVFSPVWLLVFVIIALLQKLFNHGPLFFKNNRLGRYGQPFKVLKFRSMKPEHSGQDAIKIFKAMGRHDLAQEYKKTRKISNDPRVTKFGKFLRTTSLDELPQIFNVITGKMSLVGPRPILPDEETLYKNRGALLFSVKPGITGLWQVSGRSNLSFDERVDLELYYAQNWSFWLDVRILIKTIRVVLFGKGAR